MSLFSGTVLSMGVSPAAAQPYGFDAVLDLSSLLAGNGGDGSQGFVLNGIDSSDYSGRSVSGAGDVNGDGVDDVIIGAPFSNRPGIVNVGECYVVFGRASGFPAEVNLSSLDGTTGFRLDGIDAYDVCGASVSAAGDVNGDGVDDVIVGAYYADPGGRLSAGESYVVFGRTTGFPAAIGLSSLNGTTGFRLDGIDGADVSGASVSGVGDVNGDGVDDVAVGSPSADPGGDAFAGECCVVFGRASGFPASIDLSALDGTTGFRLEGIDAYDVGGWSVSGAGDVNGDGVGDLMVGAPFADPGGGLYAGECYVVFGRATGFPAVVDLASLNGATGFRVEGIDAYDYCGRSVSAAGDVNGDGLADVIIGGVGGDVGSELAAGESYVVFGRATGFPAVIDPSSLDGTTGFRLDGIDANDLSGFSVSGAGDVNGDGTDDLLIGAYGAQQGSRFFAGESYLVFGRETGFPAVVELSGLDGTTGVRLRGIDDHDLSGKSVSHAGDVNGDGVDDIIIGAEKADPNGRSGAGESYVVFGRRSCRADWNGDHTLDAFDYDDFVSAYFKYVLAGTGFPDYNGDGYVDAFDYDDFVSEFFTGCG